MTTSFAHVPLEDLHPHPRNVRHQAVADQELVDSVRAVGILQALIVAPALAGDGYTVIGGHRRLDAAVRAKLTTAPCTIRADLVTEAQQVEAMLIENGRRQDLTAAEEAEGYEQLELFGYKPKDIAKATGRSIGTVRSRLKLAKLPDASRTALHDGEMTLADAEALTEFADDPEVLAELETHLGTGNFRYRVERARDARDTRRRHRSMVVEFEKQGASRVDWPGVFRRDDGPWDLAGTGVDHPAVHAAAGCLGWTHSGSEYRDPELVCTNGLSHQPDEATSDPAGAAKQARRERDAEFEAQRAAREAEHQVQQAAARVRVDYLVEHFTSLLTAAKLQTPLLESMRITIPVILRGEACFDTDAYMHAMGLDGNWWTAVDAHALGVAVATPPKLLKVAAALYAAQVEWALSGVDDEAGTRPQAWAWLVSTGYELSDVDEALHRAAMEDAA